MTDSETESVPDETKQNLRTSWIYSLKKPQLPEELKKFGLPASHKVSDGRKILASFIKGEYKPSEAAPPPGTVANTSAASVSNNDKSSLCNIVRKWNFTLDGQKDWVSFLKRLEELRESYQIKPDYLLQALPELLKDNAPKFCGTEIEILMAHLERFYTLSRAQLPTKTL